MRSAIAVVVYGLMFYLCGTLALNLGLIRPTDVFMFAVIMALPPLTAWGLYCLTIPKVKRPRLDRPTLKKLGLAILVYVVTLVALSYGGSLLSLIGIPPFYYVFIMPIVVFLVPFIVFWSMARNTLAVPGINMPSNAALFLTTGTVVVFGTLGLLVPAAFSGLTGSEYVALAIAPLAVVGAALVVVDVIVLIKWLLHKKRKQTA